MPNALKRTYEETARRRLVFLTAQQEKTLFRDYKLGKLTQTQEATERKRGKEKEPVLTQQADEALCQIIEAHLPFVKAMAIHYHTRNRGYIELDDLIAAGNEGLLLAARRFDLSFKVRFSTYAGWWVRNRIAALIRKERWVMHIPDNVYRGVIALSRAFGFLQQCGCEPTVEALAREMDLTVVTVRKLMVWFEGPIVSLDTPVGEDGSSSLGDFISDGQTGLSSVNQIVAQANLEELKKSLRGTLRCALKPIDKAVLTMRFGLNDGEERTLEETAKILNLPTERIRQIQYRALRKLRNPKHSRSLQQFL